MTARRVVVVVVAAVLGVWVAVAAAQGGLGGSASGTATFGSTGPVYCASPVGSTTGFWCRCPPVGSTAGGACPRAGFGGPGSGPGSGRRHGHPERPGEGGRTHHHGGGGRFGGKHLSFIFSVGVRRGRGRGGMSSVTTYSARGSAPRHAGPSCQPRLSRMPSRPGQVARIRVQAPRGGWCGGRYHVTVFLR